MSAITQWLDIAKAFLAEYWFVVLVSMAVVYYTYHYIMLIVSILIFPVVAIGGALWGLNEKVAWPDDDDNRLSPGNVVFFIAGALAFLIEIWLFSIFLEYRLLAESTMPIYGTMAIKMSVASAIGFGLLTMIFGHLAHTLLNKENAAALKALKNDDKRLGISADKILGWASAAFFLIATIVLGYSGGMRAHTLATQDPNTSDAVVFFSIAIGSIFGFMMPFGAVVGMSRGGFLWHMCRNIIIGIPIMLGMLLLLIPAFIYYLFEILLNLFTLPISKIYSIIAGFAGIQNDPTTATESGDKKPAELAGWRIGVSNLLSSAEPPERLKRFLEYVRKRINFWDVE